jgi:hypothetical protein
MERIIVLWGSAPDFLSFRSNPYSLMPGFLFKRISELSLFRDLPQRLGERAFGHYGRHTSVRALHRTRASAARRCSH